MEFKAKDKRLEGKTILRQCQLVQVYILDVIVEICEKYKINYFLNYGTLIGALRHGGFIPWDDDLDICMLKEDYDKFLSVAERELPENLTLLTPDNYGWHYESVSRVVDRCSFFCFPYTKIDYPSGIFVDIIPFVKYPLLPRKFSRWLAHSLSTSWHAVIVHRGLVHHSIAGIFVSGVKACVWKAIYLSLKALEKCCLLLFKTCWRPLPENFVYDERGYALDDIYPLRKHEFEGKQYNIPNKAESMLAVCYGDWRTPPPDADKGAHHPVGLICPTQAPFAKWSRPYNDSRSGTVAQQYK